MFKLGKDKAKEKQAELESAVACLHPLDHQEPVYGVPLEPTKATAIKCFQCGSMLELPKNRPDTGA